MNERFELKEELGRGGMGVVYRAWDHSLSRHVAVKMMHAHLVGDERYLKRFKQEARIVADLDHVNIVCVHAFGTAASGAPYVVMELVEGAPLSRLIADEGQVPFIRAVDLMMQVARGLAYAHGRQVLHRDLKPSNVMVLQRDGGEVAKIVDFGIARRDHETSSTQTRLVGSPPYMSPEQCMGAPADQHTDWYSFGCVFYETICGVPPFVGGSALETMQMQIHQAPAAPTIARPDTPDALSNLVMKLLAKSPEKRYSTSDNLLDDLEKLRGFLAGKDSQPHIQIESTHIPRRKGKTKTALFLVGVALTLAVASWALVQWMNTTAKLQDTDTVDAPREPIRQQDAVMPQNQITQLSKQFHAGARDKDEILRESEKQFAILEKKGPAKPSTIAKSAEVLRDLFSTYGDHRKAFDYGYRAAKYYFKADPQKPNVDLADAIVDVAVLARDEGYPEVAAAYCQQASDWLPVDMPMDRERPAYHTRLRLLECQVPTLIDLKRKDEAVAVSRELFRMAEGKYDRWMFSMAMKGLIAGGCFDEAISEADHAFQLADEKDDVPFRMDILDSLGQAYLEAGEKDQAKSCFEQCLKYADQDDAKKGVSTNAVEEASAYLAQIYNSEGRSADTVRVLNVALKYLQSPVPKVQQRRLRYLRFLSDAGTNTQALAPSPAELTKPAGSDLPKNQASAANAPYPDELKFE